MIDNDSINVSHALLSLGDVNKENQNLVIYYVIISILDINYWGESLVKKHLLHNKEQSILNGRSIR